MIGQSMKNLSGAGYDLSPFQKFVKADMPPGCCAMSLSTEPTGAALGDGAFSFAANAGSHARRRVVTP
jgi:hypothetical protein